MQVFLSSELLPASAPGSAIEEQGGSIGELKGSLEYDPAARVDDIFGGDSEFIIGTDAGDLGAGGGEEAAGDEGFSGVDDSVQEAAVQGMAVDGSGLDEVSTGAMGGVDAANPMTQQLTATLRSANAPPESSVGYLALAHSEANSDEDFPGLELDLSPGLDLDGTGYMTAQAQASPATNLNQVIDALLAARYDSNLDPNPTDRTFGTADPLVPEFITVGTTLNGGVDVRLENVTLIFTGLRFTSGNWTGEVLVNAERGVLFQGLLDIQIADDGTDTAQGQDPDLFGVVGVINLASGTPANLNFDDLDAERLGWPSFLDIEFTHLALNFTNFRVDDNLNSLDLGVKFTGLDTGNDDLNELLAADNPLFGLTISGSASGTLAVKEIEDTVRALAGGDVIGAFTSALAAALGSDLDGVTGQLAGKLFKVGDFSAIFIYKNITVDPDGSGPLMERSAGYIAVQGAFSIADEALGGRGTKFEIAFAISDLGPLQFYISGGPIKRFEPTTGLTIEEAHLGVRFNTTIEELQTGIDFSVTQAQVQVAADPVAGFRVTMTLPGHDFEVGHEFRIQDADRPSYNGVFTVFAVNGDDVTYKVDPDPGAFFGSANLIRLTITDPFDLRDPGLMAGVGVPESVFEWEAQLEAAVRNQIAAGDNIWSQLFGSVVIGGGATLSIDPIPDTVLQLKVDLLIDTDLRILMTGNLELADGFVKFQASFYGDLSELASGAGRFLFLADLPEAPVIEPLLVFRGEISLETLAGSDVVGVFTTDNGGSWDVDVELALDTPSAEYTPGGRAVIFGWESSEFDGSYEVVGVDDVANTITIRSATDPGALVVGSGGRVINENALGGGFRIVMQGGIDLNIPEVTTLTLEGSVTTEFRIPGAGPVDLLMDLSFNVTLSETNFGNIGVADGKFHLSVDADILPDLDHPVGGVEIWGAALLTTDFGFLESVGIYANGSGLLRINSSDSDKPPEELKDVSGDSVSVVLPRRSFALRLDGGAEFRIFDPIHSVFSVGGTFVLELSADGFNVAIFKESGGVISPATLKIEVAGNTLLEFGVRGFLAIRGNGVAADLVLTFDSSLPLGLASVSGSAVMVVNTTGEEIVFEIPGGGVDPNRPTGLLLTIPKAAPSDPSGILGTPGPGQTDSGLRRLIDGSPSWTEVSPPGPYGVVFLTGDLNLLSVLDLEVSGYVLLSSVVASLELKFFAGGSFLGLASASASGNLFFSSEGEFELGVDGYVQLGPDWININGSAALTISYLDSNGKASGGDGMKNLDVTGELRVGLTVDIDPFPAIHPSLPTLQVAYRSGEITVGVSYPQPFWNQSCFDAGFFGEICVPYPDFRDATYSFTVGTLSLSNVPDPAPPVILGQVSNGELTLNVGPDAGARNLQPGELNEDVAIDVVGNEIEITMFGVRQRFAGVTSIRIMDFGEGNDVLEIQAGVSVPVEVHFGPGQDRLRNAGTGFVAAHGGEGNDRLAGGAAGEQLFGGPGDDFIDGGGGADIIDGGDDRDTLIGGDGNDTIKGGNGGDLIAGDRAGISGDINSATFSTIASPMGGDDMIEGGEGSDIVFGGSRGDTIAGNTGADRVFGDDGSVTLEPLLAPAITLRDLGFSGDDRILWNLGDGDDLIHGQMGSDTVDIVGSDGPDGSVGELTGMSLTGLGLTAGITYHTVETLNILLGGGGDLFTIASTHIGNTNLNTNGGMDIVNVRAIAGPTTVRTGTGNDTINVGTAAGTAGAPAGRANGLAVLLTIHGDGQMDRLVLDDGGNTADTAATLTSSGLTGLGMAGSLAYFNVETFDIDLGSGDDVFNVRGTRAATNLNGNDGNDRFYVSSQADVDQAGKNTLDFLTGTLDDLLGVLNIDGGEGRHLLMVSDEASMAGDGTALAPVRITNSSIAGLAPGSILYRAGMNTGSFADGITIWSGFGDDTIEVTSTHQTGAPGVRTATTLNTGLGDDVVRVELKAGSDGFFVLNTQGPHNDRPDLSDDDFVDGSGATLPLIVFGGQGRDVIRGGQGQDIILGDRGRVRYSDGVSQLGVIGGGGPGDILDGVVRQPAVVQTVDPNVGGNDVIHAGAGVDIVLGGAGDDEIYGEAGDDVIIGDGGTVLLPESAVPVVESLAASVEAPTYRIEVSLSMMQWELLAEVSSSDPVVRHIEKIQPGAMRLYRVSVMDAEGGSEELPLQISLMPGRTLQLSWDSIVAPNLPAAFGAAMEISSHDTVTPGLPGQGGAEEDTISGDEGNDILLGGLGGDRIDGDGGMDLVLGDSGWVTRSADGVATFAISTDTAFGGDDVISGNEEDDILFGGTGKDTISGNQGDDFLLGDNGRLDRPNGTLKWLQSIDPTSGGEDLIVGNEGRDVIFGGTAGDVISGGEDDDLILGDHGLLDYSRPADPSYASVCIGAEHGGGDDVIHGDEGDDVILGQQGSDRILGGAGQDDLIGGHNVEFGSDGGDWIDGGNEEDSTPGDGADVILGDNGTITRVLQINGEWLRRIPSADVVREVERFDHIDRIGGDDVLIGDLGVDYLYGQRGIDIIDGGDEEDKAVREEELVGFERNDFDGWVGMRILIGPNPITVTQLGRIFAAGNSQEHVVKLVEAHYGTDVTGGSVVISMAGGTVGEFVHGELATPVVLYANTLYYLVSRERIGGDIWYDVQSRVRSNEVFEINGGIFSNTYYGWTDPGPSEVSYVPMDLVYFNVAITDPAGDSPLLTPGDVRVHITASQPVGLVELYADGIKVGESNGLEIHWTAPGPGAYELTVKATGLQGNMVAYSEAVRIDLIAQEQHFVLDTNLVTMRNDYTGFVGMKITVGPEPLTVTQLGRLYVRGNTGVHTVKLVRGDTGADVPGGSVSVSMEGGTDGEFVYAVLSTPVTLDANGMYYVVSEETAGGDLWYDVNTAVTVTGVAVVNLGVFSNAWLQAGFGGHSYGPVDFWYRNMPRPQKDQWDGALSFRDWLWFLALQD